jgi:hypothetical protein
VGERKMIFKITGQVRESERKIGVPNLVVRSFDKDLIYDDLLGSVTTGENGCFEIIYEEKDYKELFDKRPDIYLTIKSPDYQRILHTTEEKVRFEADKEEHFIIDIPRKILGDLAPPIGGKKMGLGKLNIWIRYEPDITWSCRVDTKNPWYVTIKDCTGRILEWCGKVYSRVGPTECGHIEIEVPPGCYVLSAIGYATGHNTFTAPAFVLVGCDETACVNLLAPIQHNCGWYWISGMKQGVREKVIPPGVADEATKATEEVLKYVKAPIIRPGEIPLEREIEEAEEFLKNLEKECGDVKQK